VRWVTADGPAVRAWMGRLERGARRAGMHPVRIPAWTRHLSLPRSTAPPWAFRRGHADSTSLLSGAAAVLPGLEQALEAAALSAAADAPPTAPGEEAPPLVACERLPLSGAILSGRWWMTVDARRGQGAVTGPGLRLLEEGLVLRYGMAADRAWEGVDARGRPRGRPLDPLERLLAAGEAAATAAQWQREDEGAAEAAAAADARGAVAALLLPVEERFCVRYGRGWWRQ